MKKAAESAAKWLADKVKGNPKLNPIPYPFFKSIVNKQVEWARSQRGAALDFEELAEAVRAELLKAGIYTMADNKKQAQPSRRASSIFEGTDAETGEAIPPLLIRFNSAGEAMSLMVIFDWLRNVFDKAHADKYSELKLSMSVMQRGGLHA